jgi:hypothetical protein
MPGKGVEPFLHRQALKLRTEILLYVNSYAPNLQKIGYILELVAQ